MRVEKITKRKRKSDNNEMMILMGAGFVIWAFIGNFFSNMLGFAVFLVIGLYAFIFLQRNDLGENKKQISKKKISYYKEVQTYVFSRNYK